METMAISKFKATCLAALERVRRTGQPLVVTKLGKPIAEIIPPRIAEGDRDKLFGLMQGTGRILGDIVGPAVDPKDWDALSK